MAIDVAPLTPKRKQEIKRSMKEEYEERAAIMEYDGEMTRDEAERKAEERIREKYGNTGGTNQ